MSTQKVYKLNNKKVNILCTMSIEMCTQLVYNKDS